MLSLTLLEGRQHEADGVTLWGSGKGQGLPTPL